MERSDSNIKKLIIFPEMESRTFSAQAAKKSNLRRFFILQETKTLKKFLYFLKVYLITDPIVND